ncbi:Type 1 glutamine amidotransferase-like domain-containing protein [Sporosarcina sp.]|uniref:Type 1 glutamine amidotransferase-like domain-containing protein n=1 Tax=Sporosarcina sp. TaxID=49982 RepID=UPI00261E978A|nr:Type 1 glutamine amidotransferase-like domain-containing protein [Sporosarcina sp.]
MKLYLSLYKIGNKGNEVKEKTKNGNKRVAYINNALDFATDLERKKNSDVADILDLEKLGFRVDSIDLKSYFHHQKELEETLGSYDVFWVRGGNTFILAQAMRLSDFDEILKQYDRNNKILCMEGTVQAPVFLDQR